MTQFLQQINVKSVHQVSGAGIWTHNHLIMRPTFNLFNILYHKIQNIMT